MAKRKSAVNAEVSAEAADSRSNMVTDQAVVAAAFDKFSKEVGSGEVVLELDPDNIIIDPAIKALRRWDGNSQQELRIPELARTISEEGQIEPCIVRETGDGYVLVAGHRRHAAVTLLRMAGEDVMLQVIVREMDENTAFRLAALENVQSEDFTGIEFGALCRTLRERYKSAGWDKKGSGTAEIAAHLGVSPATVTTHEKLLDLPESVQDDVQSGRLSVNAALEYAGVEEEARPDVLEAAKKLADRDAEKRASNEEKRQKIAQDRVSGKNKHAARGKKGVAALMDLDEVEEPTEITAFTAEPETAVPPAKPAKVTGKHIRQAAKSVQGAAARLKAPKMGEAIDAFEGWISALYPAVCVEFSKTFSEWGHGRVSDKVLEKAWDAISDAMPKSVALYTPPAETVDEKVDKAYRKAGVRPKATVGKKKAKTPIGLTAKVVGKLKSKPADKIAKKVSKPARPTKKR